MKRKQQEQKHSESTSLKQTSRSQSQQTFESIELPPSTYMNPQTYSINNRLNNILFQIQLIFNQGNVNQSVNRLIDLQDKINLLRNSGKVFDPRFEMICHYNLGCAYQAQAFQKTNDQAIHECISNLNDAIQLISEIIKSEEKNKKQNQIRLKIFQAKMLLQCCALLSQIQSHEMALQYGKQALSLLSQILKLAKFQCKIDLQKIKSQKSKSNSLQAQTLAFTQSLLIACAAQLQDLGIIQDYEGVIKNNVKYFQKIKENSYFWRDNFENNSKTFKKEMKKMNGSPGSSSSSSPFKQSSSAYYSTQPLDSCIKQPQIRNCLGMKINSSWITELNIGKVMRMTPVQYVHFVEPDNVTFEFSSRNLIQKVVLICVVYFSIATEMRFLQDLQQQKNQPSQKCQTTLIRKSQLFHFKSIQLAYKYIKQDCPLIDHLINSYLRHYHNSLASIEQKPSFVQHSQIFGQVKRSTLLLSKCQNQLDGEYMTDKKNNNYAGVEDEEFGNRKTIGCRREKKISIIDSVQLDKALVKSVEWVKKSNKQSSHTSKGYSEIQTTQMKTMKKQVRSNRKQSTLLKQSKSESPFRKQKSKRKNSSKKSIIKILKAAQR